jgi:hypothetical protein
MSQRLMRTAAVLSVCVAALAQGGDPPDLSTPRKAILAMAKAIDEGDMPALRAACTGGGEDYFKPLEEQINAQALARKMQEVAVEKFGAPGKQVGADMIGPGYAAIAAQLEAVDQVITGDSATFGPKGHPHPMKLKKVDGAWKADLDAMKKDPAVTAMERAGWQANAKAITDTTAAIRAGIYQTPQEAIAAFNTARAQAIHAIEQARPRPAETQEQPGTVPPPRPQPAGRRGAPAAGRVLFMGVDINADSVIFVCDSSGSMTQKFAALRVGLRRAITLLRPPQTFNIVFFQENGIGQLDPQLLPCSPDNKRKAFDFMDRVAPRGATAPEAALQAAFAQRPQAIFLLTDGDFPDNQLVIDTIKRLDADNAVSVNTIALIDRGEMYEKVLQQIATATGGVFRFVSQEDLADPGHAPAATAPADEQMQDIKAR